MPVDPKEHENPKADGSRICGLNLMGIGPHKEITNMTPSHQISNLATLATFFAEQIVVGAWANTLDESRKKRLVRYGDGTYGVEVYYFQTVLGEWSPVYHGIDLEDAVKAYNLLS